MIESICIAGVPPYGSDPQELSELSLFNYVFGSNGTGKTTISRIIADESRHPQCSLKWKGGSPLHLLVYNRDFVDRTFHEVDEFKGVFTLGEEQAQTREKIAQAQAELQNLASKIQVRTSTLDGDEGQSGKRLELRSLEERLKERCWSKKREYDERFRVAFDGCRNNAEKFKERVLAEWHPNKAELLTLQNLEEKASALYGAVLQQEGAIAELGADRLLVHEDNRVLGKRVVGKIDVDIAAIIATLGNSDWVRKGRDYYDVNERICPFCQQRASDDLARSLNEYFDESFETDTRAIDELAASYDADAKRLMQEMAAVSDEGSRFPDMDRFRAQRQVLESKIELNCQRIAEKKQQPSMVVVLEPLAEICSALQRLIEEANNQVRSHNKLVANFKAERDTLTSQVWRFIVEELKVDLTEYDKNTRDVSKAITAIEADIKRLKERQAATMAEIRTLEREVTSIQPTIDAINALLGSFGFESFKLAKSETGDLYKLVRPDGSDAKHTLSEGEKTFVTFLYFYHLLKGSDSESGVSTDRVVVFDDPVSSLDSDILFIVSSLIKSLFDEVRGGHSYIKQIFVLTHNVYFHKEVTYNHRRSKDGAAQNEETFWLVRKGSQRSEIERCPVNPVRTSYELLWSEVRRANQRSLTIQNSLRRILEHYFKILGGIDRDDICSRFEGRDKAVCRSLFEWMNDGSHSAHEDLYLSLDGTPTDAYLRVFRQIFETLGHLAHYKMMMRVGDVEEPVVAAIA